MHLEGQCITLAQHVFVGDTVINNKHQRTTEGNDGSTGKGIDGARRGGVGFELARRVSRALLEVALRRETPEGLHVKVSNVDRKCVKAWTNCERFRRHRTASFDT